MTSHDVANPRPGLGHMITFFFAFSMKAEELFLEFLMKAE
jgi:hypothetical protein